MTVTRSAPAATLAPAPGSGFGPPPAAPRAARSVAGALLGVVLIVFCAAAVAVYTANVGHRRAVLVVVRPVQAGSVIRSSDVGEARLSADPSVRTIPVGERRRIVGRVAAVNLVVGTLLTTGQLSTGPRVDADHATVGLALRSGQFPSGLRALDRVLLVDTGPTGTIASTLSGAATMTSVLVADAEVSALAAAADGQSTIASVMVPRADAPTVAAAGARGQVSVILLGGPAGG